MNKMLGYLPYFGYSILNFEIIFMILFTIQYSGNIHSVEPLSENFALRKSQTTLLSMAEQLTNKDVINLINKNLNLYSLLPKYSDCVAPSLMYSKT